MPRVSVVIPTYNRPEWLAAAVASVLDQDFRDLDVVVVDDASDRPEETVRALARLRGPVRIVRRPKQGGPSAARNTGIQASDSEFVAFLDDDDLWLPTKLRKQLDVFAAAGASGPLGVVTCGHEWVDAQTGRVHVRGLPRLETLDDLFRTRYNIIQTVLVRRSCVEAVGGFDESIAFRENLEFLARVIRHFRFARVDEVLVLCRSHRGPRTGDNLAAVIRGYERVLEEHGGAVADPTVLHEDYYRLARCCMAAGDMPGARRHLRRAIRLAPRPQRARYVAFLGLSYVLRTIKASHRALLPFRQSGMLEEYR